MSYWTLEHRGAIAIASYENLPMNYFVGEAVVELLTLTQNLSQDKTRVLVLTGKPKGLFVTHFSVEALSASADGGASAGQKDGEKVASLFNTMTAALADLPMPVICAMTGSTMGGGLELALGCDIRIAELGPYMFGLPEANVGILPGGGGTQRLTRLLGTAGALNMILRGQLIGPEDALARGLVHEVAKDAKARALEIAGELAAFSPVSMREIKRAIYKGSEVSLAEGLEIEQDAFAKTMASEEARDLMRAFAATPVESRGGPKAE